MNSVTLKVQIGNVAVEVTGTETYAEAKLQELLDKYVGHKTATAVAHSASQHPTQQRKPMSHSEFIKKVSPKTQVDRALVLAYFLEKYSGMEKFTTGDLAEACKVAKQQAFTNVSDSVGRLVSHGFLMGSGDKDGSRAYSLTTSGEDEVEKMISGVKE